MIKPRDYQEKILETCKKENCLVILPTGTGKTLIAIMLAIERFKKFPLEKIVILAPTRPLIEQHFLSFKKNLPEDWADLQIFTGKTPAEQRKKIWQTAEFIFSTPQCLDGETVIFTGDGPIKISEFFKKFDFKEESYLDGKGKIASIKEKVLGYDGKIIKFMEASRALKLHGKGLVKIKTEIGHELLCTKEHPILTISKDGEMFWKDASSLSKGDYIASAKEISPEKKQINIPHLLEDNEDLKITDKTMTQDLIKKLKENKVKTSEYSRYYKNAIPLRLFLKLSKSVNFIQSPISVTDACGKSSAVKIPKEIDNKLAYIIGAMLGDGHIGERMGHGSEVVFSDMDRESTSSELQQSIKEVFGVNMKKDKSKGIIAYNSALASILGSLGIPAGNKSHIIRVPQYIFFSDKEVIKGFIKGIFDTDGHASNYHVSISSVSEKFIQDLKWLFLIMNITGSIEKRKNKGIINGRPIKESEIFTFRFSGRKNLQKFLEVSPNKDKCKKLIETLRNTKKPETRSKEILPIPGLMKKIHKENMKSAEYYKFSCLSIDNLKRLSENLEGENALKLKKLLSQPIRWVKIKEKSIIEEEKEVYDLTIEKNHNFISNCLISHNCIANDLKHNLYTLEDVSLLIEDECHRCLKNYSYNYISQVYKEQGTNQRVLGLTASPGSDKETITKVCENLGITAVEIRTRESEDVKPYLQELEFDKIEVNFPPEFETIRQILKEIYEEKLSELKNRKVLFSSYVTKITLLDLQRKIMRAITTGNKEGNMLMSASVCSQAIKIQHAMELLETQTIHSFISYLKDLLKQANEGKSKGVQRLVKDLRFMKAYTLAITLEKEHPKLEKLIKIITEQIKLNPKAKTIIFTQFRDSARKIADSINKILGIKASVFVGQAKKGEGKDATGLNQKEQKELVEKFSTGEINVLVATSIAEEGLDIPEVNEVIFYEPIPSAIRSIQRRGRTARLMKGALKILITKNTRDEAYHYASINKEKRMHKAISKIKEDMDNNTNQEKQKSLF